MGRKSFVLVAALVAVVAVFAVAPAAATPPKPAAGTVTYFPVIFPGKVADGNQFFSVMNPGSVTGTFEGDSLAEGTFLIHKDGSFNFAGTITFTGTVANCGIGTVVFRIVGAGLVTGPDSPPVFTRQSMHSPVGKGTIPVHANLDLPGDEFTLDYSGTYHC